MKKNNVISFLLFIFIFQTFFISGCKKNLPLIRGKLKNVIATDENSFSCTYDGKKHDFILDLPEEIIPEETPLIVMLHGYGSSATDMRSWLHFEKDANPLGYAVAYVSGDVSWECGLGFMDKSDVPFLDVLALYLQEKYLLNKKRTYAVGYSNGAFMTYRLAVETKGVYSAFVSVAGMMPANVWKERKKTNNFSFFQIAGEFDEVIPKYWDNSAYTSIAPAIEDVVDYLVTSNKLNGFYRNGFGRGTVVTKYITDNKHNKNKVWHLFVKNAQHSWPTPSINSIDTNSLIMEFFEEIK